MVIPINFYAVAQWSGIFTLVCLTLAVIGFIFKWSFRFRLVGVTGFMGVLTVGFFALGLGLFTRTIVPGSVHYSLVYDNGANYAVIAVPPRVNESEIEATLRQAASDLYSPGRFGIGDNLFTIRIRTVIHPEPGISEPIYLGQVKRSLAGREDKQMKIEVFSEKFAKLPETTPS